MNYYERIQQSINYIESNLENDIDLFKVASMAYMSISNYYRMFFALTGYPVMEYVRRRRISLAACDLVSGKSNILDIAVKYTFENSDTFSRAFKRVVGCNPSTFRKEKRIYNFERMDILDKYYDVQNKELLEKYPEIKLLKELPPMRVAYYCYLGEEPEYKAFEVVANWLRQSKLDYEKDKLRIFGYNNPSPTSPGQKEYGYEVCITIPDDFIVTDKIIKEKTLSGGMYAVCGVREGVVGESGCNISYAWQQLSKWLKDSKYSLGEHQWMEEHLHFNEEFEFVAGIDLYMPIKLK